MKRICVYCGSSFGKTVKFAEAAVSLGRALVERNIGLVYGGASVGTMGKIADTVLENGGEVIGVIPQSIANLEVAHSGLTELKIVDSMHTRKSLMAEAADGFIALPGGLGTLEELFEALTWSQLGFHQKPCGLLNVNGYYDHLISFLDHAVDQEFVKNMHRALLLTDNDSSQLLQSLVDYSPPKSDQWIDKI